MSEDHAKVIRAAFEAWSSGGADAVMELIDPDVEWTVRPDLPEAGVYRGHAGVRQLHARFEEVLKDQWVAPQEFIEAGGGSIVVPLEWGGRGRLSGAEVAERRGETWVFTVEDGRILRVTEYRRKAEAFEAAGLSR
jgi:ketosteroid isomerase-like protein